MPAPLVPVQLELATYQVDFLALLDTGAALTLLDGVHVRAAGIDIFSGKPVDLQGFMGGRHTAYVHRATLTIVDKAIESNFAFSTQTLLRQVLGRDFLSHFTLGIRERALEIHLSPDD